MMLKYFKQMSILFCTFVVVSCAKQDPGTTISNATNKATNGYILYSFMGARTTQLIDTAGNVVKSWTSDYGSFGGCYLSGNKTLLRSGLTPAAKNGPFANGGATSGIIQELDDNSNVIWSMERDDDSLTFNHDFKEIDANTIIALAWGLETYNGKTYWDDKVVIIDKPTNTITWEWSALRDGGITPGANDKEDYIHFNSVDYKDEQILVSSRDKSTLYLIDKASKKIISAFTAGGRLLGQHDASFLDNGDILVFDNHAETTQSAVLEINPSDQVVWEYTGDFYSTNLSGAQRLSSGNTFICSGRQALFMEVTSNGDLVWSYSPVNSNSAGQNIFKAREYSDY
jgi:hypothetical protein